MKNFVLDSNYKDAIVVDSNDNFSTIPSNILPNNPISKYEVNSNQISNSYISHKSKNDNFNKFNIIDCL
ncbi:hypothetical protein [uncultured Clostridium sp.]|uniref:hypothetical protein n=1 Tax=uncultured Clostridium sp. TaxID=59620 RepID=UPI0025E3916C|nr:hypothetical protein [uncultured Clostridium sp.]